LVWEDRFDRTKINSKKWHVLEEKPYKNKELQIYKRDNVRVLNGRLQIRSEQRKGTYYSGAIETRVGYGIRYGRIEIRAKLPVGKGIFPAFWMLPVADRALPEIDIMEMVGHKPNEIWQVYHYKDGKGAQQKTFGKSTGSNFTMQYHTYSLVWKPHQLTWFLDGRVLHQTKQSPDIPMRLIINTAIGGNWPGRPDSSTDFPQYMEVDWIKVYNER
jgi:beta-glucanase (GH16 family)